MVLQLALERRLNSFPRLYIEASLLLITNFVTNQKFKELWQNL